MKPTTTDLADEIAAKHDQDAEIERVLSGKTSISLEDLPKVKSFDEMRKIRDAMDLRGERLVITSGCFDVLHSGHKAYLPQARACGDALLVALNSDRSVRELKGPGRPVRSEEVRAWLLSQLESVDYITLFGTWSVAEPIRMIQPHVYAKGGDYTLETIHQDVRKVVEEAGTEARFLKLVPGVSTTDILAAEQDSR